MVFCDLRNSPPEQAWCQMSRYYYGHYLTGQLRGQRGEPISSETASQSRLIPTPKSTPWVLAVMQM